MLTQLHHPPNPPMEMLADPNNRLSRPRQLYTGYNQRDFVNMKKR